MKLYIFILTIVLHAVTGSIAFSQKKDIAKLLLLLEKATEDTGKINILNELSYSSYLNNDDSGTLHYAKKALVMSGAFQYLKGKGFANVNMGHYYLTQRNFDEAEKLFNAAIEIAPKAGDKKLTGFAHQGFGRLHIEKGNYVDALKEYNDALAIYELIGDAKYTGYCERALGTVNSRLGNHTASLAHSFKALKYFEQEADENTIAKIYCDIGESYYNQSIYPEALKNLYLSLKYFKDSANPDIANTLLNISGVYYWQHKFDDAILIQKRLLTIRKKLGNQFLVAHSFLSIGNMLIEAGRLSEGLECFKTAQQLYAGMKDAQWGPGWCYSSIGDVYEKMGDSALQAGNMLTQQSRYAVAEENYLLAIKALQPAIQKGVESETYILLGKLSIKLKKYAQASHYLKQGLAISKDINNRENIRMAYLHLSVFDSATNNFKQAYTDYRMYILYRDSILSEESLRKSEGYKMQYEFDKKEDSLRQMHAITATKLQAQKKQQYFYWVGLVMLSLLSFFVFANFRKQKKINRLAAEAHAKQQAALELQSQQAMANERLRISSDLHDEVGATLSGIAMYSHLAKEQIKNPQAGAIENSLSIIQSNAGEMVNKLNDIVWLINPGQDSLQQLMQRLEDYAIQIAAVKNIRVKSNINGHHSANILPAETRRNIYLLFKEAINNAVKYSNASLLELYIKEQHGNIEISLKDDGDGFDMETANRGNGLNNMQQRAKEIGAAFLIYSKSGTGTRLSLQLKTPQ